MATVKVTGALRYQVEIDGIADASFTEVSGIEAEHEVVEVLVSGKAGNHMRVKQPGNTKYSNITIRRPLSEDKKLYDWRKKVEDGKVNDARKNGTITVYGVSKDEVVTKYSFQNAWPNKYSISAFDVTKSSVATEEVEFVVERLERTS